MIDRFIADNVIMERNNSNELFHPVVLNRDIISLDVPDSFKLELLRSISDKGIKVLDSKDQLEKNYYSSDSYKSLFDDNEISLENKEEFKNNQNKLVLFYSRLALYSTWYVSSKTKCDIDLLQGYANEVITEYVKEGNLLKFNSNELFLENMNKKLFKYVDNTRKTLNDYDSIELSDDIDKVLDFREKIVLEDHYGLNGKQAMSRQNIADKYSVKLNDIIRIEKRALKKIQALYPEKIKNESNTKKGR